MNQPLRLSVVLPAPARLALLERVIASLGRQRLAGVMELVIVAENPDDGLPPALTAPFGSVTIVERRQWTTMNEARVAGVWQATAPVLVFCEDHCFPAPGWADALLAAHQEPWAAVGVAFLNANPATRVSWANLSVEYGPWLHPVREGACAHVPGHNSSYKRSILLDYGDRLSEMLEAESVMHWDLRRRGLAVAMAPAARTRHENFSRFGPSVRLRFCVGRVFGASRAMGWPWWRRAAFAAGTVGLPLVRTWRALRDIRRTNDTRPRAGLGLVIVALLIFDAAGEAVGYLIGVGDQARRLSRIDHDRRRYMAERDKVAQGA